MGLRLPNDLQRAHLEGSSSVDGIQRTGVVGASYLHGQLGVDTIECSGDGEVLVF